MQKKVKLFFESLYRFLFSIKKNSTIRHKDLLLLISYYSMFLISLVGAFFVIRFELVVKSYFSIFISVFFLLLMLVGLIIFWINRNLKSILHVFSTAVFLFIIGQIISCGGTKGLGLIYILVGYSVLFYILPFWKSIGVLLLVYVGFLIRFELGNFNPYSLFNNASILSRFKIVLFISTAFGFFSIILQHVMEKYLVRMAFFDELTGFSSRVKTEETLTLITNKQTIFKERFSLIGIKIHNFSNISSHHGAQVGDELIKQFSQRLESLLPEKTFIGRYTGTVFVFLSEFHEFEELDSFAQDLLYQLQMPFFIEYRRISIQASVIITRYPEDTENERKIISNIMLGITKASKMPGSIIFYDESSFREEQKKYVLTEYLRQALRNNEFYLVYHPKKHLGSNSWAGAEILLRWTNPVLGTIPPATFIPIAEEIGFITHITSWIALQATKEIVCINKELENKSNFVYAINLSSLDLSNQNFVEILEQFSRASSIDPKTIEFEITESAMMDSSSIVERSLDLIQKLGFRLAIDDFGTGYSSLSYLHRLRVNNLKIDQSFIMPLSEINPVSPIVEAVLSMAKSLQLDTTAEGVETQYQEDYVKKNGTTFAQGWFYTQPLKCEDFIAFIKKNP